MTTPPPIVKRSIAMSVSVCLCACLSVRHRIFETVLRSSPKLTSLADLGFLEGVTLGTRVSIEGVWAYVRMKFERL